MNGRVREKWKCLQRSEIPCAFLIRMSMLHQVVVERALVFRIRQVLQPRLSLFALRVRQVNSISKTSEPQCQRAEVVHVAVVENPSLGISPRCMEVPQPEMVNTTHGCCAARRQSQKAVQNLPDERRRVPLATRSQRSSSSRLSEVAEAASYS